MYTHMVIQSIAIINSITKQKTIQTAEVYWGTKEECEEYVMSNKGNFKVVPMNEEEEFYYNYKY